MEIRPDFYDAFACRAGECRHSCCRGWEIDVDPDTAAFYQTLDGLLGDELRGCMQRNGNTWSFRLTESEDCPFLRADGLCRLIDELGEDALCDICALHPRFFEEVGEHELAGVSVSCEAAAALLLGGKGPLSFLTDAGDALTMGELLCLLGCEPTPEELRFQPALDWDHYQTILRRYANCEAIDTAWTKALRGLEAVDAAEDAEAYRKEYDADAYQRIFDYILYHQLERLDTFGLDALLRFAHEAADFIFLWDAREHDTAECLRRWSAEMEYSTENVDRLLAELT